MNHFVPALEAAGISRAKAARVLADKGSSSLKHRDYLKARQLKCGIMHRAAKSKPLTARQKTANKLIAKRRYRVEQFPSAGSGQVSAPSSASLVLAVRAT